jgi:O-antigen/teichoic acid export membrane protein
MRVSLILRSVAATWLAVIVSAGTAFFITPFILHRLGDEAYGLWVLIVALSDYYLFLQIGVRSAIVRFVSRNLALHKPEEVNRVIATSFYFFMCAFIVVLGLAFGLYRHVGHFFSVKEVNDHAFASLFLLVGIAQALDFPISVFEGSLEAAGRFDQLYGLRIIGMLLRVGIIVWVLEAGGGLFGVGAATVLSTLTLRFVAVPLAFREVEGFSLHPRGINKQTFREMLVYGVTSFSVGMSERLKNSFYPLIIVKFLSASALTLFSLPVKLLTIPLNGIGSMTEFVSPLSSQLEAQQDKAGLRRLLILCGETAFVLFAPLAVIMLVLGKQMLGLWVGREYMAAYPLLVLLTFGLGVNAAQYSVQAMLFGIGKHKGLIWMRLIEGFGTAALGILLIKFWGLWGYAFATMLVAVVINLFFIPKYVCGVLGIPLGRYLSKGFLKPCLISLPMAAAMLAFAHIFPANSWKAVIAATMVGTIVFLLTIVATMAYSQQKRSSWWSLGVVEVMRRRFLNRDENLELSAGAAILREYEKIEEQSVAE